MTPWIWDTLERESIRNAYRRRVESLRGQSIRNRKVVKEADLNETQNDEGQVDRDDEDKDYEEYFKENIEKEKITANLRPETSLESEVDKLKPKVKRQKKNKSNVSVH
jgi:hypothetical protein